uniref:Uncharacterized protein n=1 Tax=Solanum lycopersicum TaxID=4081 RepID=A0A3Q7FZA5_SOLLC
MPQSSPPTRPVSPSPNPHSITPHTRPPSKNRDAETQKKRENSQKTQPFASPPHAFLENPLTQTRPSDGNPASPTRAWTSHNGHLPAKQ